MNRDGDISPKTIEGIIDINIYEESSVFEILQELQQRFPEESADVLRRRTKERIEEKARAGAVAFFRRKRPAETSADISIEEGIERLSNPATWVANWADQLVAYEKKEPNQSPEPMRSTGSPEVGSTSSPQAVQIDAAHSSRQP
jgi:hypothetical protein